MIFCNGFYYIAENGLEYKLAYHLVFRSVLPTPTNNKNTTQSQHATYTIPTQQKQLHPSIRVLPCLHCR